MPVTTGKGKSLKSIKERAVNLADQEPRRGHPLMPLTLARISPQSEDLPDFNQKLAFLGGPLTAKLS